jgi:hypothetical protein
LCLDNVLAKIDTSFSVINEKGEDIIIKFA